MKIALIPATFLPIIGGAEIQCHNMGNEIGKKNRVDVILLNKVILKKKKYRIKYFPKLLINFVYLLKYYFYIDLSSLYNFYLVKLIENEKYDIWHFHSLNYKTLLLIKCLKKLKQKVAVTFHGADIQIDKKINYGYRLKHKYNQLFLKVVPMIDIYFAISDNIEDDLYKLNLNKKKIIKMPNGIDFKKIKKIKSKKFKKLTILTVGRYAEKKKGFDLIPKISKFLIGKIDFQWIIIGRETNNLKKKKFFMNNSKYFKIISEISNNSEYTFPNTQLVKFYKSSHVYANLARIESFGITIIEAMASFLPVLSFKTKGGDELVKNKKNGYLIKNGEFNEYSKKIISLFTNGLKNKKLIEFNNIYLSKFDLKKVCLEITNHYKKVIKR